MPFVGQAKSAAIALLLNPNLRFLTASSIEDRARFGGENPLVQVYAKASLCAPILTGLHIMNRQGHTAVHPGQNVQRVLTDRWYPLLKSIQVEFWGGLHTSCWRMDFDRLYFDSPFEKQMDLAHSTRKVQRTQNTIAPSNIEVRSQRKSFLIVSLSRALALPKW